MRFSVDAAPSRYADCARAYGLTGGSDKDLARALVVAIEELCADLAVPTPGAYGIDRSRWDELAPLMAEQALASGSPGNNPRVPDAAEIVALYDEVYG